MHERESDRPKQAEPHDGPSRADGPHSPPPPPPPDKGPTLGEGWLARRQDDASGPGPKPPTPEEKLASTDPAIKILGDSPFDASGPVPKPPTPIEKLLSPNPEVRILGEPFLQHAPPPPAPSDKPVFPNGTTLAD